jgi:hypothetical protein
MKTFGPAMRPVTADVNQGATMSQGAHHGNTPAAWTLTILALIGSTVSGVGVIAATPWLFFAGLAVVLVGCVAGQAMRMAGLGTAPARR